MGAVVISGASGFVERALVRELLENNYKIYSLVRKDHCIALPQDPRVAVVFCELSELPGLKCKLPRKEEYDIFSTLRGKEVQVKKGLTCCFSYRMLSGQ